MADQKRKYMPKSQKGLYLIGKRFFDRPLQVQELIDRAGATDESWPEDGKTVEILKRLAELENVFWERRYEPQANLHEFVQEAIELSVGLTEIGGEWNSAGMKCPDVSATVSFTGLVNIWMITVTTRGLKVHNTQPWKGEARKVLKNLSEKATKRKVILLSTDDPFDKAYKVAEREISLVSERNFDKEDSILEEGPSSKIRKLSELSVKTKVLEKVETKDWSQKMKEMKIDIGLETDKRMENLFESKLEKFQKIQNEALKAKDVIMESMLSELKECRLLMTGFSKRDSSPDNTLAIDESYTGFEEPAKLVEPATVVKSAKVAKPATKLVSATVQKKIKKRVLKTSSLLSDNSRPGYSGEGEKKSRKSRIVVEKAEENVTHNPDKILRKSIENPKKDLESNSKDERSLSGSVSSIPELENIGTQNTDVALTDILDQEVGMEFELELKLDNEKLEKVKKDVIAEEQRSERRKRNERAKVLKREKSDEENRKALIGQIVKRKPVKRLQERLGKRK